MPDLAHDVRNLCAGREQQEMKVRRNECGVIPSGSGLSPPDQVRACPLDGLDDDTAANVVAVLSAAALGREQANAGVSPWRP